MVFHLNCPVLNVPSYRPVIDRYDDNSANDLLRWTSARHMKNWMKFACNDNLRCCTKNCDLYLQVEARIILYESPIIRSFYKIMDDVT